MRRLAVAVLGVALLVGASGAERSQPSRSWGSEASSSLLFDGPAGVYALGADGRGLRLVVRDAYAPQWSADGNSMMFVRGNRLYHLDLSTGRVKPFPAAEVYDVALSPSGTRIAYRRGVDGLFVAQLGGGRAKRLTSEPDGSPAWSPDGKSIAFERGYGEERILIMTPEGRIVRVFAERGSLPRWSPDGRYIAYTVSDDEGDERVDVGAADGTERWHVTPVAEKYYDTGIAWSPRSDRLAVTGRFGRQQGVFVTGVKGNGWRMVARSADEPSSPAWSNDAARLAFNSGGNIWVAGPDRFGKRLLLDTVRWGYEAGSPAWDPHGRPVASLPGRPVSPAIPPLATAKGNRLDTHGDVLGIAADRGRLALLLHGGGHQRVEVWDPSRRQIVAYPDEWENPVQVALAGERVLWRGQEEGNHVYPFVVTARSSRRSPVSVDIPVDWNRAEHLLGQGSLLVFDSWTVDGRGQIHDRRLWRMVGDRSVQIPAGANVGRPLAVDAGRIAVLRDPHTLTLIDARGKLLRSFSLPDLNSPGTRLSGNRLALLGRDAVVVYDIDTGRRVRHRELQSGNRTVAGLGGGMVAYLDNHFLHLIRISDGQDTTLGRYDRAILNASGLFTVRGRQVTFRRLATISNRP